MRWHDCYYHFWSAVLLNEGCCQASCMGMIILRGICGLVPPGWMWWMGRKWWCLKHSQVLPDPSHSIITVAQFDWAQIKLRPHETHWGAAPRPRPCTPIDALIETSRLSNRDWFDVAEYRTFRDFFLVLPVLVAVTRNSIWMCVCEKLLAIWSHYKLPNVFCVPFFLDPESDADNVASSENSPPKLPPLPHPTFVISLPTLAFSITPLALKPAADLLAWRCFEIVALVNTNHLDIVGVPKCSFSTVRTEDDRLEMSLSFFFFNREEWKFSFWLQAFFSPHRSYGRFK